MHSFIHRKDEGGDSEHLTVLHLGFSMDPQNCWFSGLVKMQLSSAANTLSYMLPEPLNEPPVGTLLWCVYHPQRNSLRKKQIIYRERLSFP